MLGRPVGGGGRIPGRCRRGFGIVCGRGRSRTGLRRERLRRLRGGRICAYDCRRHVGPGRRLSFGQSRRVRSGGRRLNRLRRRLQGRQRGFRSRRNQGFGYGLGRSRRRPALSRCSIGLGSVRLAGGALSGSGLLNRFALFGSDAVVRLVFGGGRGLALGPFIGGRRPLARLLRRFAPVAVGVVRGGLPAFEQGRERAVRWSRRHADCGSDARACRSAHAAVRWPG